MLIYTLASSPYNHSTDVSSYYDLMQAFKCYPQKDVRSRILWHSSVATDMSVSRHKHYFFTLIIKDTCLSFPKLHAVYSLHIYIYG